MIVSFEAPFDEAHEFAPRGSAETDVFAEATVKVALSLQSFSGGLRAKGTVEAPWHAICRRCSNDVADLAPLVHDAILLDLPLAPLCRADCRGLCPYCGIDRNEDSCDCSAPVDARWATLDELRFTDFPAGESKEM